MFAKIYQPAPSAMQSGRAHNGEWVIDFTSIGQQVIDPLTGTLRGGDMLDQVDLKFDSLEDAVAFVKSHGIAHRVVKPKTVKRVSRSYSDNFAFNRRVPWTH